MTHQWKINCDDKEKRKHLHREYRQPLYDKKHARCAIYKQWTTLYTILTI
jgi:hypothetical protein